MSKQVEVLIRGKQQTEGTLHSLQRQVDALHHLISSTSSDPLGSSLGSLHEALNLAHPQVILCTVKELWSWFESLTAHRGGGRAGAAT